MRVSLVVVGHSTRKNDATELAESLSAGLTLDDGRLGSNANHARAWGMCDKSADWVGVVEDDAIPAPDILRQLDLMLSAAPTEVVSGYLGTGRPQSRQEYIQAAIQADPTWVVATKLLHHVAVFARPHWVPAFAQKLATSHQACDTALGELLRKRGMPVGYCMPSLFDHRDETPLIERGNRRPLARVAWRHGVREDWSGPVAFLDGDTRARFGGRYVETCGEVGGSVA